MDEPKITDVIPGIKCIDGIYQFNETIDISNQEGFQKLKDIIFGLTETFKTNPPDVKALNIIVFEEKQSIEELYQDNLNALPIVYNGKSIKWSWNENAEDIFKVLSAYGGLTLKGDLVFFDINNCITLNASMSYNNIRIYSDAVYMVLEKIKLDINNPKHQELLECCRRYHNSSKTKIYMEQALDSACETLSKDDIYPDEEILIENLIHNFRLAYSTEEIDQILRHRFYKDIPSDNDQKALNKNIIMKIKGFKSDDEFEEYHIKMINDKTPIIDLFGNIKKEISNINNPPIIPGPIDNSTPNSIPNSTLIKSIPENLFDGLIEEFGKVAIDFYRSNFKRSSLGGISCINPNIKQYIDKISDQIKNWEVNTNKKLPLKPEEIKQLTSQVLDNFNTAFSSNQKLKEAALNFDKQNPSWKELGIKLGLPGIGFITSLVFVIAIASSLYSNSNLLNSIFGPINKLSKKIFENPKIGLSVFSIIGTSCGILTIYQANEIKKSLIPTKDEIDKLIDSMKNSFKNSIIGK